MDELQERGGSTRPVNDKKVQADGWPGVGRKAADKELARPGPGSNRSVGASEESRNQ